MNKKKIIFFTGAGISKESGIDTFRDKGGLWDKYPIEQVATATAMYENTEVVLEFFNERRNELKSIKPNLAHELIAKLEDNYEVVVITQNVDDLHERAGSTNVIHLHGELTKVRSMKTSNMITDIGYNSIDIGDLAPDNAQLRPHVVLFGEDVPKLVDAKNECTVADYFVVIGTSLNVFPAASIIGGVDISAKLYNINLDTELSYNILYEYPFLKGKINEIQEPATVGMDLLYKKLMK